MTKHLFGCLLLFSVPAFASEEDPVRLTHHEIVLTPAFGSVTRYFSGSHGIYVGTIGGTSFGYHYSLSEVLQVGLSPTIMYASGISLWDVTALGSLTFNLFPSKGIQDSAFLALAAGPHYQSSALETKTLLQLQATLGQRYELFKGVSYRPSVSIIRDGANPTYVRLDLLSFALTF